MKKFLAITALMSSLVSGSLMAAETGSLLLQGIVGQKVAIKVTGEPVAASLDLTTSQTDLKVATVNEVSNSKTGYKVRITSANLSKLKRTDGSEVFAYTLKYGGSALALSTSTGTTISSPTAAAINVNKDLAISYTGAAAETMVAGTYADTVTFDISAN